MYDDNFHTDSLFSDTWRATLMTVYAEGRGESHREWYFVRGTKWYCRRAAVVFCRGQSDISCGARSDIAACAAVFLCVAARRGAGVRRSLLRERGKNTQKRTKKLCLCTLQKEKVVVKL